MNRQEIARISGWATTGLRPHLTVVLDVDPAASAARALGRSAADRLEAEDEEFRTAVREQFLDLSLLDSDRYLVVDASVDPEEVTRRIVERLRQVPEYVRAVGAARKDAAMANPPEPADATGETS
jgi:dTMP kinase